MQLKETNLLTNLIQRHVVLSKALMDFSEPRNAKYIEDHIKYLWDISNKENGQLRGL